MALRPGETNILGTDLGASLRFYRDVLGFEVVEREGTDAVHLRLAGRPFLILAIARERATPEPYGRRAAISFDLVTPDLEGEVARLRAAGVPVEGDPRGPMVVIRDPDGLAIELVRGEG